MSLQCSLRRTCMFLEEALCFPSISMKTNVRMFYNDSDAIEYMSQRLRREHRQIQILINKEKNAPKKKSLLSKLTLSFYAPAPTGVPVTHVQETWKRQRLETEKAEQCFIPARHKILGNDLAAAHFVVHRGGRAKFEHMEEWFELNKNRSDLPNTNDPDYVLIGLDLNGYSLMYEGIDNISALVNLKWLSLRGCKYFDDWCVDKISAEYPKLEYLDISECINITERGLEALYRMPNLKTLIITNHYNSATFELTCLMLEDMNPFLKCEIRMPEEYSEESIQKMKDD